MNRKTIYKDHQYKIVEAENHFLLYWWGGDVDGYKQEWFLWFGCDKGILGLVRILKRMDKL